MFTELFFIVLIALAILAMIIQAVIDWEGNRHTKKLAKSLEAETLLLNERLDRLKD